MQLRPAGHRRGRHLERPSRAALRDCTSERTPSSDRSQKLNEFEGVNVQFPNMEHIKKYKNA